VSLPLECRRASRRAKPTAPAARTAALVVRPCANMRPPSVVVRVLVGGTILYVARAVRMPMTLAVLLTFLLAPIVGFLERRRLGRVLPVLVVVVLMFGVLGGITWALARQFVSSAARFPATEKT
jgi:predicted PurR-regulated permease PerM